MNGLKHLLFAGPFAAALASPAAAEGLEGRYLCSVLQKAGLASTHLEGDPGPAAFAEQPRTRFRMEIIAGRGGYIARELEYAGSDRDQTLWHTQNSVLHGDYHGQPGQLITLTAVEDQAFLRILPMDRAFSRLNFYHAGFEYPGDEDTALSVRFGRCDRE